MTTAGNFRSTVARAACDVSIAGVPWPAYKVIALVVGIVAFLVVGALTMSAAPAVLSAAGAATASWVGFGIFCADRR
ncbi:hypothetical protein NIIDNTM18_30450 [Mycolicibacterium litorale]|uniref:Uncharacterized protein n=1 Tax=Mycolicibacterium litorale TaxID=758802 RepID=A0A6S6P8G3_9MYCO|nr:hypothetical protein [Mycolicibacterium litorale]BCI53767.1 hypothetical protein NIIDNTM18_30450 [Mycolicibacterium litorale]